MPVRISKYANVFRGRASIAYWALLIPLLAFAGILLSLFLVTFAAHSKHLLTYPYPLDYGEGPLLMQIIRLQEGWFPWQLYRDPALPPYGVVNYPPFYPMLVAFVDLAGKGGHGLLVGRLLSLVATGAIIVGIVVLATDDERGAEHRPSSPTYLARMLRVLPISLLVLTIPVFREWAVLLRVDMVGVGLGIWGLIALQKRHPALAALLILCSLYTKPLLMAAPISGFVWLIWCIAKQGPTPSPALSGDKIPPPFSPRRSLLVYGGVLGVGGGLLLLLLQWASGGWFLHHIVIANANRWDGELARQFWLEQWQLRWPLVIAVITGIAGLLFSRTASVSLSRLVFPLCYTLIGTITALGVGKVGAYANYFLEWYVGLIWLLGAIVDRTTVGITSSPSPRLRILNRLLLVLVLASMMMYSPLWSTTRLLRAGLVEENPPRLVFGRQALWEDLAREHAVLDAFRRGHAALISLVRDGGEEIFTDMPGVAAEAGVGSRMQVFEHRQLLDQGVWDAAPLMRDLANGAIPLAVIEYLGNWIPPDIITIITHRYAQDGAVGGFDCYRPVAPGPRIPINHTFSTDSSTVWLSAYHLGTSLATLSTGPQQGADVPHYEAGEIIPITLEIQHRSPDPASALVPINPIVINLSLVDESGNSFVQTEQPLFYGAFDSIGVPYLEFEPLQHMQPIRLPPDLPSQSYSLMLMVRMGDRNMGQLPLASIVVKRGRPDRLGGGMFFSETGYHVPAPFLHAREQMGGEHRTGYPLSPAVPFAWGWLQCFEYTCLEWRNGEVVQRPVGEEIYRMETLRSSGCLGESVSPQALMRCPAFASHWRLPGYETSLGEPISGEVHRNGYIVQWTRYARLERLPEHNIIGLGRLGEETLRLIPGMRYRWPGGDGGGGESRKGQ